jgi:membrane-associated protease RseP (regulator of RpoE activity)
MGTVRQLTASVACGALLGLAASGIVRTHFSSILAAMTTEMALVSPKEDDESGQAGGFLSVLERDAEDMMPESQTILASTAKPHSARSRHSVRDTFPQELNRGIRKLGERRYEIKRHALELALGNLALLSKLVRAAPEIRDGKPVGYRLFAISADGPMAKLGLRNDDVLVSINGLDIATPDRVLQAYSKLRTASQFALGLVRAGRQISQEYVIR